MVTIFDQINVEELTVKGREIVYELLKEQVRKNVEKIVKLMKQVIVIEKWKEKKIRREQQQEWLRKEYKERWEEKEQRKRQEREEAREKKRIDDK